MSRPYTPSVLPVHTVRTNGSALPAELLVGRAAAGELDQRRAVGGGAVGDVQALAAVPGDDPDEAAARVLELELLVRAGVAGELDHRRVVGGGRVGNVQ